MNSIYLYINIILLLSTVMLYLFLLKRRMAPRLFLFYLVCFILFNETHIILSTISDFKFGNSYWFFLGDFSDEVKSMMVSSLNSYLIGMILSMCVFSSLKYKPLVHFQLDRSIRKFSLVLYIMTLPFVFIYLKKLLYFIRDYGFYALYEKGGISGSIILDVMFIALYALLVTTEKKTKVVMLIVFSSLIYILIGLRLEFIFKVFPVIFYYVCIRYKPKQIFNKKAGWFLVGIFAFIYLMQYSVSSRDNENIGASEHTFVYQFLSQQGVSVNVLGMAIKDEKNPIIQPNVILSPIVEPFKSYFSKLTGNSNADNGNSYKYAISSLSLSHKLSYIEDPEAYLGGYGVGGAAIAELYLFGGFTGCFIGGFFVFLFILLIEKIASINVFFLLFAMTASSKMVYSPRGEYFSFLSMDRMVLLLVALSIIIVFLRFVSKVYMNKRIV